MQEVIYNGKKWKYDKKKGIISRPNGNKVVKVRLNKIESIMILDLINQQKDKKRRNGKK